jgi:hypothetical protein
VEAVEILCLASTRARSPPFHPILTHTHPIPSLTPPKTLQRLGFYDPLRKETNLNAPAIKKWLSLGAQPSETVGRLLSKAMITADE